MKKQMLLLLGIIFSLSFLETNACKTALDPLEDPPDESLEKLKELADFANWPGKNGLIREGVNLNKYSIPSLSDASITSKGSQFYYQEAEDGVPALVHHTVHWEKIKGDFLVVDLYIAESCDVIHEYAIQRFFYSSMPFELRVPKKDDPPIAGEISFSGGRRFIRNNIFVEISPNGEMLNRIAAVAKDIDNLLLARPTASSAEEFKPMIQRFEIANSLVESNTTTKLFLEVSDPKGSELYYFWQVTAGGIGKNEYGEWYYDSSWVDPGTTQTITVVVINDRGYYRSSSIDIKIKQ